MQLDTPRLIMRDFAPDDWPAVLAYQQHPLYLRYNDWTERTPAAVRQFVQMFIDQQQHDPRLKFQLALVLKDTGDLIGNCGIRRRAPDAHEADIGYELAPEHWGRGYATEAVRAILRFGFVELKLHRISADLVADNAASARVLEKNGLQLEGRLRDKKFFKGRWWDTLLYAILEPEWQPGAAGQTATDPHSAQDGTE
jgi:[ribosomal protein S5]-alanine N-acetyltransferase